MEQELIQAAISTFCTAPDLYQKIFQQMDVNFPDELVQAISDKPKEAVQMVQQNKELLNNIVTIYQQYGDQINQVIQQRTGMFAKGGKLNYLLEKSIVYAQDGTKISRRDAMQMAMGAGLSKSQARTALMNANRAVGKGEAEMVYNSFKDKQINTAQPTQLDRPERRILSTPASKVAIQTPTLATPSNLNDFEAQRAARKNEALEGAYNEIMAGKWGNGHDVRAQRAAETGLNYNDVRAYVNAHAPRTAPRTAPMALITQTAPEQSSAFDRALQRQVDHNNLVTQQSQEMMQSGNWFTRLLGGALAGAQHRY